MPDQIATDFTAIPEEPPTDFRAHLLEKIAYIEGSANVVVMMPRAEALRLLYMQRDFLDYLAMGQRSHEAAAFYERNPRAVNENGSN